MKRKSICFIVLLSLALTGCVQVPEAVLEADATQTDVISPAEASAEEREITADTETEEAEPQLETESEQQSAVVERKPETTPQTVSEPAPPTVTASEQAPVQEQQQPAPTPPPAQAPQPEPPTPTPVVVVEPPPAQPSRPAFDAGTVIGGAAAQISGFMTRESGTATGMGWFTFSFSVYDSTDKMIADLTAVMRQEHDLYGNVWFDLEYLGESGGYHTFKCYRA